MKFCNGFWFNEFKVTCPQTINTASNRNSERSQVYMITVTIIFVSRPVSEFYTHSRNAIMVTVLQISSLVYMAAIFVHKIDFLQHIVYRVML